MNRRIWSALIAAAALGLVAVSPPLHAQTQALPIIQFVPASSYPPIPSGLKLTCVQQSNSGAAASDTCPVVTYRGITTWAYSFDDNRVSFALVSYDERNTVVRNDEKPGARYIFNITSGEANQIVTFIGQAQQAVTVPWSEIGPK